MPVAVVEIRPVRVRMDDFLVAVWVRVMCCRWGIGVDVIVVIIVVPVTVHVLYRWMSVEVRVHAAEHEPGRPQQ
jgi:hypothetical protein